ncbi:hypothetical protein GF412_04700 [Candidatus Micrarchaeota archaeon]|nr:hypothetical protein [Candidatus Micrarchaeota archaeon]MBD3418252.1 hypothetical protein [Candidatus Micrarchaeota archaeon]
MSSIWNNGGEKDGSLTGQIRAVLGSGESEGCREMAACRASRPPMTEKEREIYDIFYGLRDKSCNLIQKRKMAEEVLRGEYGIKHELYAKLLLGPSDFRELLEDPRDIVVPLTELPYDRDQRVREKIAKAFAERGDERALAAVYAGMGAKNYSERYEYGRALAKIAGKIEGAEPLREALGKIKELRENSGEFTQAMRCVKKRLAELGEVLPKTEKKRVPLVKVESAGAGAGRKDMTIPMGLKKS